MSKNPILSTYIWECLEMQKIVYFTAIRIFSPFWYDYLEKSGSPAKPNADIRDGDSKQFLFSIF
jgi:hypothetical protein